MDPRVEELLPVIETFGFGASTIPEIRARFRATASTFPPPVGVTIEATTLAGRHSLRFMPVDGSNGHRILHLHGGAFVVGHLDVQLTMPGLLSVATGCEVISLDYRVAPEHPCPAAIDDAVAAYEELLRDGPVLAVAGESAGGSLTVLTAIALRSRGTALPRALLTFSPWMLLGQTTQRGADESFHDAVFPRSFAELAAPAWRGALTIDDPRVTPLTAELSGLPPTLIHVGGDEVLLEDSLHLADRLAVSSVQVELRVFPGMPHVFPAYPTLSPECDQSLAGAAAFLTDAER